MTGKQAISIYYLVDTSSSFAQQLERCIIKEIKNN